MRLYSLTGATALDDARYGRIDADPVHGGFDLPEDLSEELRSFPAWETDVERQQRLVVEEMERRKDPATLLDAVQQLVAAAQAVSLAKQQAAPADAVPVEEPAGPEEPAEDGDVDGGDDDQQAAPVKSPRGRKAAASR